MNNLPPIYDGIEPLHEYRNKLDIYMRSLKTQRYNTILNFVNDIIDKKHPALMDFKNVILHSYSKQHIRSTINKHTKAINENFKKQINLNDDEEEENEDIHEYLILLIKDLLYHIEFTLNKRVGSDATYFSIINKPSPKSSNKTYKRLSGESKSKQEKPKSSEPKSSEPKSSEPKSSEPKTSEPKSSEPKTSEPKSFKPKISKPKSSKPKQKPKKHISTSESD